MSLASTLRPASLPFKTPFQSSAVPLTITEIPFHHEPSYLQLQRMLIRYQNLILLNPFSESLETDSIHALTPLQRQIQAELYCPLPYHRTKWLHIIESARNLSLSLEKQAQSIKAPHAKKDALKDLAEKRQVIRRLKNRVEEIGREVESLGDRVWQVRRDEDEELLGTRADEVLRKLGHNLDGNEVKRDKLDDTLREGKPAAGVPEKEDDEESTEKETQEALFGSSLRRRQGQISTNPPLSPPDKGTTSGFSNLAQTEKSLQTQTREHEDLTSALVSMAAQLKQQSRAFQFSLSQDDNLLNRAMEGLDRNISGMEVASKNMAFLRRMSEEQGWLGRLKLYGIILAMWVFAVLLVFVGPKLRF